MATRYSRIYIAEQISIIQNSDELSEMLDALQVIRDMAWTLGDQRQKVVAAIESELSELRRASPSTETQQRIFDRLENAFVKTLMEVH